MPQRLTSRETTQSLRTLGLHRSLSAAVAISDPAPDVRYEFHRHPRHQLLFPEAGILFVETADRLYICSPQAGLWIPAATRHATTTGPRPTISLYFPAEKFPAFRESPAVIRITPFIREAARHAIARGGDTLFRIVHEALAENVLTAMWPTLPVPSSDILQRTTAIALASLEGIDVAILARRSGQSERAMRRRFLAEFGLGPERFLQHARLIRAMHILMEAPDLSITEVALSVGYSNHSAFSAAFRAFCGQSPRAFRRAIGGATPNHAPAIDSAN